MIGTCGLLTYVLGGGGPTVEMNESGESFVCCGRQQAAAGFLAAAGNCREVLVKFGR